MAIPYNQYTNFFGVVNKGNETIPPYSVVQLTEDSAGSSQKVAAVAKPYDVTHPGARFGITYSMSIKQNQSGQAAFFGLARCNLNSYFSRIEFAKYAYPTNDDFRLTVLTSRANSREGATGYTFVPNGLQLYEITSVWGGPGFGVVPRGQYYAPNIMVKNNLVIPATTDPTGTISSAICTQYWFDRESETLVSTTPDGQLPAGVRVYNHTPNPIDSGKFLQAKWIHGAYFVDVEPCDPEESTP